MVNEMAKPQSLLRRPRSPRTPAATSRTPAATWRHAAALLLWLFAALFAACEGDPGPSRAAEDAAVLADLAPPVSTDADPDPADATADAALDAQAEPDAHAPEDAAAADLGAPLDSGPPPGPLTLNSVIPNRGPAQGGTALRLIGTGFYAGLTVRIGDASCENIQIESSTLIRCETPAGALGAHDLRVFRPQGILPEQAILPGGFTYFEALQLRAVHPARVPTAGGVDLIFEGEGLIEGTTALIDGQSLGPVRFTEERQVVIRAPAHAPGAVDVEVQNLNGHAHLAGGLTYYEPLRLDALDPPFGPLSGGTRVRIEGQSLRPDSRVRLGDRPAELFSVSPDHREAQIFTPPAAQPGPATLAVENPDGQAQLTGAYLYYDPDAPGPHLAGIIPTSGPPQGGQIVHVVGSGLTAQAEVSFGAQPARCTHLDAHALRCESPPGPIGAVDIMLHQGAQQLLLPEAYRYVQPLQLTGVLPERGAIAGGTRVELHGRGFEPGVQIFFDDQPLRDVQRVADHLVVGYTPPHGVGAVDVRVENPDGQRGHLPAGYRYFDPSSSYGGVWGDPIEGALNITVRDALSGAALREAAVLAIALEGALYLEGLTDERGQVTLSHELLRAPASVTAALSGYEVTTVERVESENVTIYLLPNVGESGDLPPGVPGVILKGEVSGLDALPKPLEERYVNVIFISTTHTNAFNRTRLPPPGPGGLLFEDGPYQILARPGELAVVATAGEIDRDVLQRYQDSEINVWTARQYMRPLSMGLRRYITASPGQTLSDLHVVLDHPMDQNVPITLDNPPMGPEPGPLYYGVLPRMNLGAEGFWEFDQQGVSASPQVNLSQMPTLEGWGADLSFYLIGLAFSATDDNLPMSVSIEETRDLTGGVHIGPFVGTPYLIDPVAESALSPLQTVHWGVHPGVSGPATPPSANLILISEPAMGEPKPLWRYFTPSERTHFEIPLLPAAAEDAGLGESMMFLEITPFIVQGPFNFEEFTYDEFNNLRWKAWSVSFDFFYRE